jgi:hypothetical protein
MKLKDLELFYICVRSVIRCKVPKICMYSNVAELYGLMVIYL